MNKNKNAMTVSPLTLASDCRVIKTYWDDAMATATKCVNPRRRINGRTGQPATPVSPIASAFDELVDAMAELASVATTCGVRGADTAAAPTEYIEHIASVLTHPSAMRQLGMTGTQVRAAYATVHDVAELIVRITMPINKAAIASVWQAEIPWEPYRIAAMLGDLCGAQIKPNRISMAYVRGNIPVSSRRTTTLADVAAAIHVKPLIDPRAPATMTAPAA